MAKQVVSNNFCIENGERELQEMIVSSYFKIAFYPAAIALLVLLGFLYRDFKIQHLIQLILTLIFIMFRYLGSWTSIRTKVRFLVAMNTSFAMISYYFQGISASGLFCFILVIFTIALMYNMKHILAYIALSITLIILITLFKYIGQDMGLEKRWMILSERETIYFTGFTMIVLIISRIIIYYRQLIRQIFINFTTQRSELIKINLELEKANRKVETLSGLIPICSHCKKIRDDKGYWNKLEKYIEEHSQAQFSHGLCQKCAEELYGDKKWFKKMD